MSQERIELICKCCAGEKFHNRGKFTRKEIENVESVKAWFEGEDGSVEHMWVLIHFVENQMVYGELNNDPVLLDLKCGDKVTIPFSDIEEIM